MARRQTMPPLRVTVSDSGHAGELGGSLERDEDRKGSTWGCCECICLSSGMASREGEEMVDSSLGWIKVGEILWLSLGILLGHWAVIVLGTSKSGTTGSEGV